MKQAKSNKTIAQDEGRSFAMNSHMPIYVDTPDSYGCGEYRFYKEGGSPGLLEKLVKFFNRDIVEIKAALYLFNNEVLHDMFTELGRRGVKVDVVSIPLDGYDESKPKLLTERESCQTTRAAFSKRDLAESIYEEVRASGAYTLHIFEHVYVRSEHKVFARGKFPFSLHTKSFLLTYADGTSVTILTSSNLVVRDRIKEEMMVAVMNETPDRAAEAFFTDLFSLSRRVQSRCVQLLPESPSVVSTVPDIPAAQALPRQSFFTAPFYYESHEQVEAYLFGLIAAATREVLVCAQHICALDYDYEVWKKTGQKPGGRSIKRGFLAALRELDREAVEVKCLSQTYAEAGRDMNGIRRPSNPKQFERFSAAFRREALGQHAVNKNIHAKFIVVDDKAVVTTCNFTPTQFMHLPHASFKTRMGREPCVFGEVGHWMVLEGEAVQTLKRYFHYLWDKPETRVVIA